MGQLSLPTHMFFVVIFSLFLVNHRITHLLMLFIYFVIVKSHDFIIFSQSDRQKWDPTNMYEMLVTRSIHKNSGVYYEIK